MCNLIVPNFRTEKKATAEKCGAEFVSSDELFRTSDIIIICCALTDETKGLFDKNISKPCIRKMESNPSKSSGSLGLISLWKVKKAAGKNKKGNFIKIF